MEMLNSQTSFSFFPSQSSIFPTDTVPFPFLPITCISTPKVGMSLGVKILGNVSVGAQSILAQFWA